MIDTPQPCRTGYTITLTTGERLFVWPELGLVVSELAGEPKAVGVSSHTLIPLTDETASTLQRIWIGVLSRWRARR